MLLLEQRLPHSQPCTPLLLAFVQEHRIGLDDGYFPWARHIHLSRHSCRPKKGAIHTNSTER